MAWSQFWGNVTCLLHAGSTRLELYLASVDRALVTWPTMSVVVGSGGGSDDKFVVATVVVAMVTVVGQLLKICLGHCEFGFN